jgi:hypothetical protein
MAEKKGVLRVVAGFFVHHCVTARYAKLFYPLHLLFGLVVAIWTVFTGFQSVVRRCRILLVDSVRAREA